MKKTTLARRQIRQTVRARHAGVWTGYFAAPGGVVGKVHVIMNGKAICGAKFRGKEFQWCAPGVAFEYVRCEHCKKIIEKTWEKVVVEKSFGHPVHRGEQAYQEFLRLLEEKYA